MTDLADAGILFPAVIAGIPIPADLAGILLLADLAEPVTVGVADLADAGILFPAIPAGIPIPADPAGFLLFPVDLAEPVTVGVADLAVAGAAPLAVPDMFAEFEWWMKWRQWMGFPCNTVVIMTVYGIQDLPMLDMLAILMVSPRYIDSIPCNMSVINGQPPVSDEGSEVAKGPSLDKSLDGEATHTRCSRHSWRSGQDEELSEANTGTNIITSGQRRHRNCKNHPIQRNRSLRGLRLARDIG